MSNNSKMTINSQTGNKKRIAKNTLVLYIRMIVVMLITLYTSRVVLKALGVDDFGLYGVIGGVVGLFAFLKTSMGKATQRFLNVEMVAEGGDLKKVFRTSMTIHFLIAIVILVLAETIGLWFLNAKINIPEGREFAANFIFQTTVISICVSMIEIPFHADIIAHEKMTFFAVISVMDAFLKLLIAFLILNDNGDRLILYGILMMAISLINVLLYYLYCKRQFFEISLRPCYDRERFKSIFGFVGWTLLGQAAILGCNQGNGILVNMFHSVAANEAMSIGSQVSNAVTNLSSNFQTAFNPQITKSYAEGNYDYLRSLVFSTSKISYCLLFVVMLPIAFNIDFILDLWLDKVPDLSNIFCILFMANAIINALSAPLNFSVMASGNIKWFQIVTAIAYLSDLVILYFLFNMGLPPTTALWVKVGIMIVILFVRLYYAHREIGCIDFGSYIKQVLIPLSMMSVGSIAIAVALHPFFTDLTMRIILTIAIVLANLILMWFVALNRIQRESLINIIQKRRNKNVRGL